jgi:lysophospholipase
MALAGNLRVQAPAVHVVAESGTRLISIPANPVPEGVTVGTLKTRDGVSLRYARWEPPQGRKGTVCIFEGRTEFIEKYFEVVRDLRARGFAVAILDWRGQGLSQRRLRDSRKGHVRSFDEYDLDLETFAQEIVLPDCPPPFFALGHSMGAAVLLRAAIMGHRWFDRMVLSAPLIRLVNVPLLSFAPMLVRTLRYAGLGGSYVPGGGPQSPSTMPFGENPVTSDPVRHARAAAVLEEEPALLVGAPTNAWMDSAFRAMAEFADPSFAASVRHPMLLIACGRDRLVSTPAIEEFATRLRAGSHLIVPGARHEILMEQDYFRSQFWAAFDAFIPGSPLY